MNGAEADPEPLSPNRVLELLARHRTHCVSTRDPRACSACGSRYPCHYRIDARNQLTAAGVDPATWR